MDNQRLATGGLITDASISFHTATLRVQCEAPAPVVVNGGVFAGCILATDHDGRHKFVVEWGDR